MGHWISLGLELSGIWGKEREHGTIEPWGLTAWYKCVGGIVGHWNTMHLVLSGIGGRRDEREEEAKRKKKGQQRDGEGGKNIEQPQPEGWGTNMILLQAMPTKMFQAVGYRWWRGIMGH